MHKNETKHNYWDQMCVFFWLIDLKDHLFGRIADCSSLGDTTIEKDLW